MAVTVADVVSAAEHLSLPELEVVLARLTALRAERAVDAGDLTEADLIRLVQEIIPPVVQQRYNGLKARRRTGTLTDAEHQEFLRLIELVEHLDAQRLEHLLHVSRRRGESLAQVMDDLGLTAPAVE